MKQVTFSRTLLEHIKHKHLQARPFDSKTIQSPFALSIPATSINPSFELHAILPQYPPSHSTPSNMHVNIPAMNSFNLTDQLIKSVHTRLYADMEAVVPGRH